MYRISRARWLPLAFLLTVAIQPNLPARDPYFSSAFLSDARVTQPGKPVAVRIADPFARVDQERALLKLLNEPHKFGWGSKTSISDIGRDLGKHIALQIDHRALDEIGLTADERVFTASAPRFKKTRPAETPAEDPFAYRPSPSSEAELNSTPPEPRWWDRKSTTTPAGPLTNAAVLFHGLSNADLVIATWSGQWLITTQQAAEENLSARLYDVTPIADIRNPHRSHRVNSRVGRPKNSSDGTLIDVIQTAIAPDSWDVFGGLSNCRAVVIGGCTWLVVSAPVTTHWKIQALLNRLNGS